MTNSITTKLLDKLAFTRQDILRRTEQSASDLDVLYQLGNQQLLSNFEAILSSDKDESDKKEALKQLLADRWQDIKGSSHAYCEQPRDPLNQLCLALALYISPLPEDLSKCDDWDLGDGPYFVLMPDLQACADLAYTNIHQLRLHEFILSEDGKRYIPIFSTLQYFFDGTAKKPFHTVFTEEQMYDQTIDKGNDPLSEAEINQLTNHSENTAKLMQSLAILKDPNASFYNRLNKLADGLLAGSSHGGSGQSDNAAAEANEAIIEFFDYWDGLPNEMRELYLRKVSKLGEILERLRNPVAIAAQGVNYCVGLTGSDLRYEVRLHREHLEDTDISKLKEAIGRSLEQLEHSIKQPSYTLKPVTRDVKPVARRVMDIPVSQQKRLISDHLHLDYPNFLLYAFDQQPDMISVFVEAFKRSRQKADIIGQRANNGMSVLMIAAQSYPNQLEALLTACLELRTEQLKDEIMVTTESGDSLPLIILQRRPQALPQLFEVINKLDHTSRMHLLTKIDVNNVSLMMMAMESNADAFAQLCQLIATFPAEDIATILKQANQDGDTLLMMALRNYPNAVSPLMRLFDKCKHNDQATLVKYVNNLGLTLPFLALNTDARYFQSILNVVKAQKGSEIKVMLSAFSPMGESFFLRASYGQEDNFNAVLDLLDNVEPDEQFNYIQSHDLNGNHLLLLAILHQETPSPVLFNKLKLLPPKALYQLLTRTNNAGLSPISLALTQRPQYFANVAELISLLSKEQQDSIWQQKGGNGWYLPFLTAIYAPQHLPVVMDKVNQSTQKASIHQTDFNGNGIFEFTANFQPENLSVLMPIIQAMPNHERFRLLSHCNNQGDNLLSWIVQQNNGLLDDIFQLMKGFSVNQQVILISNHNKQRQHALGIAYQQDTRLLEQMFQLIEHLNGGDRQAVLAKLPISNWFDLLSMASANQSDFLLLYQSFKAIHRADKKALCDLLSETDHHHNNLLMLMIQNNPTLVPQIFRDIKLLPDEKVQRLIMFQTNSAGESVMSLAEQNTPDNVVVNMQSLLKKLDKKGSQILMRGSKMKMQSADVLISSETLEDCGAQELLTKLQDKDSDGNNLLGQILLRMPHRLPTIIDKMNHLLSPAQIKQLVAHQNNQGLNLYWLALEQPKAPYLCHQLQTIINKYENPERMTMLTPPAEQSMIERSIEYGKASFAMTMRWIDTFDEEQRLTLIRQFWHRTSEQFKAAIQKVDVDVCQRLINTTQSLSVDETVELMRRNQEAISIGLGSRRSELRDIFSRWLLSLPQNRRFDVLSALSTTTILSLLDNEQLSLIDALPLQQQASLFSMQDNDGQNLIVQAIARNHACKDKLITRLSVFTPQQLAMIFQGTRRGSSLLHQLAQKNRPLFIRCLAQLRMLPSQTQLAILEQVDGRDYTVLDYLDDDNILYKQVLDLYASLSLNDQVQLFSRGAGRSGENLLLRAPHRYRTRLFEQFKRFPQSAQIEILLSMNDGNRNGLKSFVQTSPELRFELFNIIQSFPKHIQGTLCLSDGALEESLIGWMIHHHDDEIKQQALILVEGLAKTDIAAILSQKSEHNGNNLLQALANRSTYLFDQALSIFMTLPNDNKVDILTQQNKLNKSLLADLVRLKRYDQFEQLCQTIAKLSDDDKVSILSNSGIVPVEPTTLWVSLLYGAPQSNHFINLLNNKAFYPPMFHLLQTLPPDVQVTILTNRTGNRKTLVDHINEPEKSNLKLALQQAKALQEARQLLNTMAANIANEQVNDTEFELYQRLAQRLDTYQNTYYKSFKHVHDLSSGWAHDIQEAWPNIDDKLSMFNVLVGLLKLAACVLMPLYGAYKVYEKVSTNRNVLFKTDQESIIYRLEDLAAEVEQSAHRQVDVHASL